MPLNPEIWHYNRHTDAKRYIDFFDLGISNSLTLFAKRRFGKTALLLNDIRPTAHARGYNVVYATFWDNKSRPALALLTALKEANHPITITQRIKKALNIPISDLSLSVADIKISVKLNADKDSETDILHKLNLAFNEIAKSQKRTILMLDEVQHLATDPKFEPLVATIRSAFDKHPGKLCALYTGSSRDGLHKLFRDHSSPLFNAAQEYPLPPMKADFVNFVLERYFKASGRKITIAAGLSVWKMVDYSPYDFMAIIERMLTTIEHDIKVAAKSYMEFKINDPILPKIAGNLKAIDKLLLLSINEGHSTLYSEDSLDIFAERLGVKKITKSIIQNSIRRLREKEIISKAGDKYDIEMPLLVNYLLKQ